MMPFILCTADGRGQHSIGIAADSVSSNLLGIFTMPFILCQLLGASGSAVAIKPGPLLANLLKTILAPLLAGAAIRSCVPGER